MATSSGPRSLASRSPSSCSGSARPSGRARGETKYGLKAIPFGGFTRMIGMLPPKRGDDPSMLRPSSTGRFSQLMDQAREQSIEEVKAGDEDRVFYKLSPPKKLVVMLGGPTMNLLIAVVLLGGIFT